MALSAVGLFAAVFGIQEGQAYNWGKINGILSIPLLIGVGVVMLVLFVIWQGVNRGEPLVPLSLFADRNFSLANVAITAMGFTITALIFPFMIWAQTVRGMSPTMAALVLAPSSVMSFLLAPLAGWLTDRVHPRLLVGSGTALLAAALVLLSAVMTPDAPLWQILIGITMLGIANPLIWGPLSTTATRNLPMRDAGAGSGVYNTTRQMGAVLGSAAIAVLMESRLAARLGESGLGVSPEGMANASGQLPPQVLEPFSRALGESMLLPAAVILTATVVALFFELPRHLRKDQPAPLAP